MSPARRILLAVALVVPVAAAADAGDVRRPLSATLPQAGATIVVSEGEWEPRSIGSYSLRVYAANPDFPYDNFITGLVRARDGILQHIGFSDIDRDGNADIVVFFRSVGSGNYLAAEAFRFKEGNLTPLASVSGLRAQDDAMAALRAQFVGDASGTEVHP